MLRSALFVDFDNIYISLEQGGGGDAAERFARDPLAWVAWLERRLGVADGVPTEEGVPYRRLLVRRVYLNPQAFNRYRAHFIRSGFEVIDTPPLTMKGKTSADTHMVLDVLDNLAHETRFDEFVVFSGDADFTPLLLRLRKHDRRTAVLAIGPSSPAYKAACDLLIDEERFLEEALGQVAGAALGRAPAPAPGASRVSDEVLARIGRRLDEMVELMGGLDPWQLPQVYKEFPEFSAGSNWLGYFSLKAMTEAIVRAVPDRLVVVGGDDWRIEPAPGREGAQPPVPTARLAAGSAGERFAEIGDFLRRKVADAAEPPVLAALAHAVIEQFGEGVVASRWLGTGSFKSLLGRLDLGGLLVSEAMPGYLYDPARHEAPSEEAKPDGFADADPELAELARTVHDLTDTPYLPPQSYAVILGEIARELDANGFHLTTTSKAVRDQVHERGVSVSRADIGFLLKGLSYSGYRLHEGAPHDPVELGRTVAHNTVLLCQRAQMELSDDDRRRIERWMLGGLLPADQIAAAAAGDADAAETAGDGGEVPPPVLAEEAESEQPS